MIEDLDNIVHTWKTKKRVVSNIWSAIVIKVSIRPVISPAGPQNDEAFKLFPFYRLPLYQISSTNLVIRIIFDPTT